MTHGSASLRDDPYTRSGLISVDGRVYPIKSAKITARAEGGIAASTLIQVYENPHAEALEVFYTLPLPADGAVAGYTIRMGNRVIRGEVRKREEAREEYRKAILKGQTAALLEQQRDDTFSQKLGNLPPGVTAAVEIEILQPLSFIPEAAGGQSRWEYRFPTVVGVRYEGGPGRVPDVDALDVDRAGNGLPVRLEASLLIADGPADRVRPQSPEQRLRAKSEGEGVRVELEEGMPLNRDLVIRWAAGKQSIGARLTEGKGLEGDPGRYALITLTPPNAPKTAIARDLTLLIDCSGSMSGGPIEQAKTVAAELLRSLDPGDRFEILAFSDRARRLFRSPRDAGEKTIGEALEELRKLQASGSTEMKNALVEALRPLRADSQRQVILLSDGYIGFEREVIGEITRRLVPGARVHVVGVGSSPNRTLTRGAAQAGGGIEIIIGLQDDAKEAAVRLLHATVRPVLTGLRVEGDGLAGFAPRTARDVFEGQPALIFEELRTEGGTLKISGTAAGSSSPWVHSFEIPRQPQAPTSIPLGALYGRAAVADAELDLSVCPDGESGRIKQAIEALGLRHRISSSMTSLIAISEDITVDPSSPRRRERLPAEIPDGVSAEGVGLLAAMPMARAVGAPMHQIADLSCLEETDRVSSDRPSYRSQSRIIGWMDRLRLREDRASEIESRLILIGRSRVLKLDGQILVFEFEVPVDGFILPHGETVRVGFDDGVKSNARVMEEESTRRGPHGKGLTVRLALKLEGHRCWHHGGATVYWHGPPLVEGEPVENRIEIRVRLQ